MSRFFSRSFDQLEAYVPGEQPRDMKYVKLNTNESPFPPTEKVKEAAAQAAGNVNRYNDPECTVLRQKAAELYGVGVNNVVCVNGSDEALYLAFWAYRDETFAFPDITYGFYKVFCDSLGLEKKIIPLNENYEIDKNDYMNIGCNIVIANPNAQTGVALPKSDIEEIIRSNPDNIVIVDEAYIDFGGDSCVDLIDKYENLIVTQTFSKSRCLAGARIGFAIGCEALMADLNTLRYSMNPYNVNTITQMAAAAAIDDNDIYMAQCREIMEVREYTVEGLDELGFKTLPSSSNFIFTTCEGKDGTKIYLDLKERGVLVRHFDSPRMKEYIRVTIGSREQMEVFLETLKGVL